MSCKNLGNIFAERRQTVFFSLFNLTTEDLTRARLRNKRLDKVWSRSMKIFIIEFNIFCSNHRRMKRLTRSWSSAACSTFGCRSVTWRCRIGWWRSCCTSCAVSATADIYKNQSQVLKIKPLNCCRIDLLWPIAPIIANAPMLSRRAVNWWWNAPSTFKEWSAIIRIWKINRRDWIAWWAAVISISTFTTSTTILYTFSWF